MDSRKNWSRSKVSTLERLLKTLDRLELMLPYLVTIEMKPMTYLNKFSDIEYESPGTICGAVIRVLAKDRITWRVSIDEDEE